MTWLAGVVVGASGVWLVEMRFSSLFTSFGWLLALIAAGLLLIPWRWHRRFGEWPIPLAIKHMKLFALGAFALGAFILYGLFYAI